MGDREQWVELKKGADFHRIAEKFGIDPVVARVIRNRDIIGDEAIDEYLNGGIERLKDPFLMKDMDQAVRILKEKIRSGKKIRVIGDYDIDGIMASYILKRGLTELGADADIRIPNRVLDGYGINENLIRVAHGDGIDTIITCDNGISACEQVRLAKTLGMTVVVTDHHEVTEIPEADAVVDPRRPDDLYPNKNLCGAAVAWKLILAMGGDPELDMLQYAAFATVGDIMELTGENRILVKEGLKRLRNTENPGLRALAEVCGISISSLSAYHIGFVLGPCLNASGRLDTAMRASALLEAPGEAAARPIAEELRSLNESRKNMTEYGVRDALKLIETDRLTEDRILVIFLPEAHESIAGIIAGRVRESTGRPAFVLTRTDDGVKGSGRSTEEYSMFEELVKVRDLLLKFGGHPMAAGLSLKEENIPELRARLNRNCTLTKEQLRPKIRVDMELPVHMLTEELIGQLGLLEPFGKGNEKPLFGQRHVFCEHPRMFGVRHNLLKTRVRTITSPIEKAPVGPGPRIGVTGAYVDAIAFRDVDELEKRIQDNPDLMIAYQPEINEYMGSRRIQIVITHFQ